MLRRILPALAAGFALLWTVATVQAGGAWLDRPLTNWNTPGMMIPAAPPRDPLALENPRCAGQERPAETVEDDRLVALGWRLYAAYEAGWGVKVISALSGYDGMCRPFGYQQFVFVEGAFAGTASPELMNSRFDGASSGVSLFRDRLVGRFLRYTSDDPLCCPSAASTVEYHIERTDAGPVLVPDSVTTQPTLP